MSPKSDKPLRVFVIAGEASGDTLGAQLLHDLQSQKSCVVKGIGGKLMQGEGLSSLFPMEELSLMGVVEILPKIPTLLARINQTAESIIAFQPDVVITIDAPDFSHRVAKRIQGKTTAKLIHYVAPTVWAWRAGRAKKVAALYDAILCLFPFEPVYFEAEGMAAFFVGHPFLGSEMLQGRKSDMIARYPLLKDKEILGVFFGSRRGELKRTGLVLKQAAEQWLEKHPNGVLLVPTLDYMYNAVESCLGEAVMQSVIVTSKADKIDSFAAMDRAIAVSGTIGLELSLAAIPHLIAYKANALTAMIVRAMIKTRFAHLTNILLDRPVVPEFIQEACTGEALYKSLEGLNVKEQKKAFEKLKDLLHSDISAAEAVLKILN